MVGGLVISILPFPSTALASSTENLVEVDKQDDQIKNDSLTETETMLVDRYVSYNKETKQYQLNMTIKNVMSTERVNVVENYIKETNRQLKLSENNHNEDVYAISPSGEVNTVSKSMLRKAGVTRIDYHWNYARIKISAGTLKWAISGGIAISGVYAPAKIVRAACALAGVSVSAAKIKHGIWFDYNYFNGILCGRAGRQ
ncbi:hypothetical protein [Listeria aquatica]|uniref:Uncharacterized protein n=1 Tax=Listeria aquatica FSL S10-1188 TaxID=1265818 RepID=W7BBK0_9LIST|nr:hypothetical protein [Listeria aquatica]EUJ17303.1 hypothetical protein MAQA_14125 [Listeria aquatica FSL S10-1188]